jgi:protein-disulfide isomerase
MRFVLAVIAAVLLAVAPPARADDSKPGFTPAQRAEIVQILREALKADPSILRDAVAALQADDAAVKEVAARAVIAQQGPALTRAEGDVRCPYCRRMLPIVAQLLHTDPRIRLVYKDIPILGPASVLGARAVLAAQRQGGYQKLHDIIMAGSPNVTEESLQADAGRAGLDWARLQKDMADPDIERRLSVNLGLAHALGIEGTPAYVVGGRLLPGAVELAELQDAVAAARSNN